MRVRLRLIAVAFLGLFGEAIASEVSYRVVDESTEDLPIKAQVEQHIVVEGRPTESQLRQELSRRFVEARKKDFRHHPYATNVFLFIYATEEQAQAGQGLWIARLGWTGHGESGPADVQVNMARLDAAHSEPENRFGLTESERKQVLREIAAAENRATDEAIERYSSDIDRQLEYERSLQEQYRNRVLDQWGITSDQASKIVTEGLKKGWPY